jgi:hypothetical protein
MRSTTAGKLAGFYHSRAEGAKTLSGSILGGSIRDEWGGTWQQPQHADNFPDAVRGAFNEPRALVL